MCGTLNSVWCAKCGVEPRFKAAAVKYGRGFIRELAFGGYFGPILMTAREQQDEWLAVLDPQHGLSDYQAKVLMLSGTDDIFFWMPGVLATYRAIPTDKRLVVVGAPAGITPGVAEFTVFGEVQTRRSPAPRLE